MALLIHSSLCAQECNVIGIYVPIAPNFQLFAHPLGLSHICICISHVLCLQGVMALAKAGESESVMMSLSTQIQLQKVRFRTLWWEYPSMHHSGIPKVYSFHGSKCDFYWVIIGIPVWNDTVGMLLTCHVSAILQACSVTIPLLLLTGRCYRGPALQ